MLGALAIGMGSVLGVVLSMVLIFVVNRQSVLWWRNSVHASELCAHCGQCCVRPVLISHHSSI